MSEENESEDLQNENGAFPVLEFEEFDRNEEPIKVGDGIEVIKDDSLEYYSQNLEEEVEEFQFTLEETKKLYSIKLKKDGNNEPMLSDEELLKLPQEVVDELKEIQKNRDRKALLNFVNRNKKATDEEAAKLTDEEYLDLTNKALIMSKFLKYNTKKDFGIKFKKERQRKNKQAKASRRANR